MNMFARFDENPAMALQDIKETKRYGRTHTRTDAQTHTHGQRENSIPHHKQSLRGYKNRGSTISIHALFNTLNEFNKKR